MVTISKNLIITEKPSVAKQFATALGVKGNQDGYIEDSKWVITWCVGHLITLSMPEKYDPELKKWSLDTIPFLPERYKYEVLAATAKQFKIVKGLLNRADIDTIYNAGDSGREGEYIQRLVYQAAGVKGKKILRVWIDSQTDAEIKRGIREAKPASAYDNLAAAAYERAIADFAVGINLSRALSCKFGRAFNAAAGTDKYIPMAVGRVMTCVLGMVVDREREIRNFKPVDYYKLDAEHDGWTSHWKAVKGSKFFESDALYNDTGLAKKADADALLRLLQADPKLTVSNDIEKKTEKQNAPALFNLAELQAECTKRFKISPAQTLEIAQSLYEKKMTTYPRTDARVMSTAVAVVIKDNIQGLTKFAFTKEADTILNNKWYAGIEKNKRYVDDSKVTDHYAIIPTGDGGSELPGCSDLEKKVFDLICRRFLAVFYPSAVYNKIDVDLLHSSGEHFFASEKTLVDPGFKVVYSSDSEDEEDKKKASSNIGKLKRGDVLKNVQFKIVTSTTQPPKRYTSGSIVLAMEGAGKLIDEPELREQLKGSGIGTSATRAETISKLEKDSYIDINKKTQTITPTTLGESLYDIVADNVPQLLSPRMTASWEKGLAQVEAGAVTAAKYRATSEAFVRQAVETIKSKTAPDVTAVQKERTVVGKCPRCGKDVIEGKKGFGCVGYKDDPPCKFTIWKTSPILDTGKKSLSAAQAKELLAGKNIIIKGLKSAKSGKSYDARFTLEDDGQYANLKMSFDDLPKKRKKSR